VGRGLGEQPVQELGAAGVVGCIDDLTPPVDQGPDCCQVALIDGHVDDDTGGAAALDQILDAARLVVGQVDDQLDRVLSVRVEMHKDITARLVMADTDGHSWQTRSRHPTSHGLVSYQRCHCGLWRLVLEPDLVLAAPVPAGERPASTQRGP
jgi:hypothetical protein